MKKSSFKTRKACLFVCFIICALNVKAQQEVQFSQYIFNGLYINPAAAGAKEDFYVHSFYRSQWTGVTGAPQSFSVAADGTINDEKVGLGILLAKDKIGAQNSLAAYANYAYRLQVGGSGNQRLSFGLGAGLVQSGIDGSKLNAGQDGDNVIPVGYQSTILPDARAGVLYTSESFFAGFSADNLVAKYMNRDKSLTVPIPNPHFYLTAGTVLSLNDDTRIKPSFLLKNASGTATSLDLNTFLILGDRFWIGGTYRTSLKLLSNSAYSSSFQNASAVVAQIEFFATSKLRIGYAFDYSMSAFSGFGNGSHELSLGIYLTKKGTQNFATSSYF
ncbi:PorP/SprF family type IX secretion system membrane protein [Mucilaginibacter arboris]|uniref:Type IX secretion system membrane protein PorP/SprF n=1 Tax=Mucilaginibacter arboris TaxID=2682090 RepID=A0A7K1SY69_9SPHI|nr:type IX secretion system membrane protein PorP/SprF [Mucilaginibacter arboris]MVN22262.1 type IX secretion system membrane protein PorP/SprF [Mucilaginibacter arboris]